MFPRGKAVEINSELLRKICPALESAEADQYAPLLMQAMLQFDISTPRRQSYFLAQIIHESQQLTRWVENLNYSAERLMAVWPKRFPSIEFARLFARQPEKLANYVYANRNGNGSIESGDGWKYRGRSPLQITGKANYKPCGEKLKLDLVGQPELIEQPQYGFLASAWWWWSRGLNSAADQGAFDTVTKTINGSVATLPERATVLARVQSALEAQ